MDQESGEHLTFEAVAATFEYSDSEGRKIRAVRLRAPKDAEGLFGEIGAWKRRNGPRPRV